MKKAKGLAGLPAIIKTQLTVAQYSEAQIPAAYDRALVALQEAIDSLSFERLKEAEINAEALAAMAKMFDNDEARKKAGILKLRHRRAAFYIARRLLKQGANIKNNRGRPAENSVLRKAGYPGKEAIYICQAGRLTDEKALALEEAGGIGSNELSALARGNGRRSILRSSLFTDVTVGFSPTGGSVSSWIRNNNARGIARIIVSKKEQSILKQRAQLVVSWCQELIKNLPKPTEP